MLQPAGPGELIIEASVAKHLALAPVAFAVTEGRAHTLVFANAVFRRLQETGEIALDAKAARGPPSTADLTPLLDEVFQTGNPVRDVILRHGDQSTFWSCTVWRVPGSRDVPNLVIEVRDVRLIEGAKARQRAVNRASPARRVPRAGCHP